MSSGHKDGTCRCAEVECVAGCTGADGGHCACGSGKRERSSVMIVPFAMVCDACQRRGDEYDSGWAPSCTECERDLCAECAGPGHVLRDNGSGREWWEEDGESPRGAGK